MGKVKASKEMMNVLINWNIKRIYGLPGDSIDTTVDALHKVKDQIEFIQVRHEEVASLAAASEAKLTGNVGVCLSIGGPGAIHLLNGLYDAKMDHVPVVALVGQVASKFMNSDFFQEVDNTAMFQDVAVFNKLVQSPESLPVLLDEAIRTAINQRGVAVLTIPDNFPDQLITETYHNLSGQDQLFSRPRLDSGKVEKVAKLLKESKRPIILSGVGSKDSSSELKRFIEMNHLPIIQTMPSKGVIADNHLNSLGNVGKLGTKPAYEAMKEADLLIMLGTNYPYVDYLPKSDCTCIQIDINPQVFGKRFPVTVALEATVKDFLTAINELGELRTDARFLTACQQTMIHWNRWMTEEKNKQGTQIHPAFMMSCVEKIATPETIFSIDVGTSTSWGARFLSVQPTQSYLISAWLGTMGCALPGAIAAKLNYPERQVISVAGDGAFAMVMQDFVTAVKYDLPFVQFVVNNQKLAFIEYEQESSGQLNYEIDLADIDFAKVAEACGGTGYTVRTPEELEKLLPNLKLVTTPTLVNVYVTDDAPLPGKIVKSEAEGYGKFTLNYLEETHHFPKLPPLKEILRQFL
ncbi:pyruvate oxidase [Vagococcus penaei]|uniref:Pyruvate oxidase n=1 Tax=Vagococcus penaei TaxID=633807 RepID=A0A1Q2D5E3_9ENTE|nr:pyruvate oxidase [Vagococcus penaei]AQP53511.1 pyruvate oxidase [Vagococcus penaei]RSU07455.1 pyruvate oxidase [Vagococcus penaei]